MQKRSASATGRSPPDRSIANASGWRSRRSRRGPVETFLLGDGVEAPDLEGDDLRPRSTMGDLLELIEMADKVVTIG